jgi:peptide/nickel transport system substrate-binding protein
LSGFAALAVVAAPPVALAGGAFYVAITAYDLPVTTGNPDQGFEGYRFIGYAL